jgi:prepilin-type N-terminal cleavage/methylation domain-containing protein
MINNRDQKGFTLIETMMYLALFGLLIGGAVAASYNVIESSNRSSTKSMLIEEGNFLVAKINWALSGVQSVNLPASDSNPPNNASSELSVTKWDSAIGNVDIKPLGIKDIGITKSSTTLALNNTNVSISNLLFDHVNDTNTEYVTANFTLTANTAEGHAVSQDFNTTKYLRK